VTKQQTLDALYSLHYAAQKVHDAIDPEFRKPFKGSAEDEPARSADVLYGRIIALGTAIQAVEQIDEKL
jgi:hypothetical protein